MLTCLAAFVRSIKPSPIPSLAKPLIASHDRSLLLVGDIVDFSGLTGLAQSRQLCRSIFKQSGLKRLITHEVNKGT